MELPIGPFSTLAWSIQDSTIFSDGSPNCPDAQSPNHRLQVAPTLKQIYVLKIIKHKNDKSHVRTQRSQKAIHPHIHRQQAPFTDIVGIVVPIGGSGLST